MRLRIGNSVGNTDAKSSLTMFSLIGILFLAFIFLAVRLLFLPALNQGTLSSLFYDHADTRVSSISKSEYPALAEAISGYLAGNRDTAQYEVIKNGNLQPSFHERELEHLKDVKSLVEVSVLLRNLVLPLIALVFLVLFIKKDPPNLLPGMLAKSAQIAAAEALGFILLIVLYAGVDFDHVFTMLHQAVFRNDLWLMDPQTDLMIQLMPQAFFSAYAQKAMQSILLLLLLILAAATGFRAILSRRAR